MLFDTNQGPFPPAFGLEATGRLAPVNSIQSTAQRLSIGFETLDRELFDPDECYEVLGQSGVKWARCQSGWSRCEKKSRAIRFPLAGSGHGAVSRRRNHPLAEFNVRQRAVLA